MNDTPAPLFDCDRFQATVTAVAARFEKLAPTVADWCDWLAAAGLHEITLADVRVLEVLAAERHPNMAANLLYHHQYRMGRDVCGQAGF